MDAELLYCLQNHFKLSLKVIVLLTYQKCKIQIPQIMKYRPPARNTSRDHSPVFLNPADLAFLPSILVLADYNRVLILPQV